MSNSIVTGRGQTEMFLAAIFLLFLAVIFGSASHITISITCLFVAIPLLFFSNIQSYIKHSLETRTISAEPHQKQSFFGTMYTFLVSHSFFANMSKNMRQTTVSGAISSGSLANPDDTSKNIILVFVLSFIISVIISLVGFFIFDSIFFLLSFLFPLFVRLYPTISNTLKSSDMTSFYNLELAYFLSYLQISVLSGFGLYDSMMRLYNKDIFQSIGHDAATLHKWISLDGYAESEAINRLAENHSHGVFQSFLFSYCDIMRSNPDGIKNFVTQTADEELEKITDKDEKRITKISAIFVYGAMGFIMAPVMMLTMMFLQSDAGTITLITYAIFLIPVVFVIYVFTSHHDTSDISLQWRKLSVLGLLAGIPCYMITGDALASIALSLCVTCAYNGRYVSNQISLWRSNADGFPKFIRDLIERYKVDANFVVSIQKILSQKNHKKKYGMFYQILGDVNTKMYAVTDVPHDLFYDTHMKSKRMRLLIFILQTVFDGGHHSSISSLERIHTFSTKLNAIKNKMDDSMRMSSLILFAAPSIFFLAMLGLSAMLMSFTTQIPEVTNASFLNSDTAEFFERPDFSAFLLSLKPAVFIMSLCSGVVISKAAYSSLCATMPIGTCLGIAFVILVGWDFFFDAIQNMVESFL